MIKIAKLDENMNFCKCGCGSLCSNLYKQGHNRKNLKHSNETLLKMSKVQKGKVISEAHKLALHNANKGKHLSDKTKERISEANKGRKNPNKGIPRTKEVRVKIGLKNKGKIVTEETRAKIGNSNRGKIRSDETKLKLSNSHKGITPTAETILKRCEKMRGQKRSLKARQNISESKKGKAFSKTHADKIKYNWLGRKHTLETKQKMRISAINHRMKVGKFRTNTGINEKRLLDELEVLNNCKILRNFHLKEIGYFVDGYCKENNTVYEIYEKSHLYKKIKDLERQQEIQNFLGCEFKIIWDL